MTFLIWIFWGNHHYSFPYQVHQSFTCPPTMHKASHFSISSPTLIVFLLFVCFLIVATLIYVRWYHTVVLLCVFLMSSCSSVDKESACRAGDPGSIPGLGRSPGEGNGNLLQYPCLRNPMERRTCHGVALCNWAHTHFHSWSFTLCMNSLVYSQRYKKKPMQISRALSLCISLFSSLLPHK